MIGTMAMPADFRYREVFLKGKPRHTAHDGFRIRHPIMDAGHRAKIFSPFDALKGFGDAIAAGNIRYRERIELMQEEKEDLDRKLHILKKMTVNRREAEKNGIRISITYFVPCSDTNSDAYGLRGQYRSITGICRNVDEIFGTIQLDEERIAFGDILKIENTQGIFRHGTEEEETPCARDIL